MNLSTPVARVRSPGGMVAVTGSAIALCIMGDSLMYSVLPIHAVALGLSLPLVGVLLSANRIVRLFSNQWAGAAFGRYGPRLPFIGSVILGLITTFLYGIPAGFFVFLLARIAWGIAWSGLRQGGYVATWTGAPSIRGRLTGFLFGLIRLGSAVGVVLGGVVYDRFGFGAAVGTVAVVGLLAIPVSADIPWRHWSIESGGPGRPAATAKATTNWRLGMRMAFQLSTLRWLALSSFVAYMLGGIVVSTTSLFVASKVAQTSDVAVFGIGIATVTGLLHGARWSTNLLIGPLVGALSDRIGRSNALLLLGISMFAALFSTWAMPPLGSLLAFLVVLLLDGSLVVVVNATATTVATETASPHQYIATFATLTDAGSALGPLIAFSALATTQLPIVYGSVAAVLLLCLANFWWADRR